MTGLPDPATSDLTRTRARLSKGYGACALVWRLFVCAAMIVTASVFFHGDGILLSALATLAWFAAPIIRGGQALALALRTDRSRGLRGVVVPASVLGLVAAIIFTVPVPFDNSAPGVVATPEGAIVRSRAEGFIQSVHVQAGQNVEPGTLLVTLRNDELDLRLSDLQLQIRQEEVRLQTAIRDHAPGPAEVSRGILQSLYTRLEECRQQVDGLQVRAGQAGQIVVRNPETLNGVWVDEGQELMVVDNHRREFHVSVSQEDFAELKSREGEAASVQIGSRHEVQATIHRVIPRASRNLRYPSLAASAGGPLPVHTEETDDGEPRLANHRFHAVLEVDDPKQLSVTGERGYITVASQHPAIAVHAWYSARKWLVAKLDEARQQGW